MDIASNYISGDHHLVEKIVQEIKSQGIFDQFRKECIADVDTKPAYQNLRQRVESNVTSFLTQQKWTSDMNKNQVREMLRKSINESGFLDTGVERIVDQVVNPKITTIFLPKVENVFYKFLGIEKPCVSSKNVNESNKTPTDTIPSENESFIPMEIDSTKIEQNEFLDAEEQKLIKTELILQNSIDNVDAAKIEDEESPPFEPLEENAINQEECSVDSHSSVTSAITSGGESSQSSKLKSNLSQTEVSIQDSSISLSNSKDNIIVDGNINKDKDNGNKELSTNSETKTLPVQTTKDNKSSSENKCEDKSSRKHSSSSGSKSRSKDSKDRRRDKSHSSNRHKSSDKDKSRHRSEDKNKRDKDHNDKDKKTKQDSNKEKSDNKNDHEKDKSKDSIKDKNKSDLEKEKTDKDKIKTDKHKRHKSDKEDRHKSDRNSKDKNDKEHSNRDAKERDRSKSSSKKESNSKDKSNHKKREHSSESKSKEESKSKSRKDDKSKNHKEEKRRKSFKDDHYSAKTNKNGRNSSDRDSDGQSNKPDSLPQQPSSNGSRSNQENSVKNETSNGSSEGNSDNNQNSDKTTIVENTTDAKQNTVIKFHKPKFALNMKEALKIMKIRKQLKKLEQNNQLNLVQDFSKPVPNDKSKEEICSKVDKTCNILAETKNAENKSNILIQQTVPAHLSSIKKETWDELEAKFLQQIGGVDYNSYESPDGDDNFDCKKPTTTKNHNLSEISVQHCVENSNKINKYNNEEIKLNQLNPTETKDKILEVISSDKDSRKNLDKEESCKINIETKNKDISLENIQEMLNDKSLTNDNQIFDEIIEKPETKNTLYDHAKSSDDNLEDKTMSEDILIAPSNSEFKNENEVLDSHSPDLKNIKKLQEYVDEVAPVLENKTNKIINDTSSTKNLNYSKNVPITEVDHDNTDSKLIDKQENIKGVYILLNKNIVENYIQNNPELGGFGLKTLDEDNIIFKSLNKEYPIIQRDTIEDVESEAISIKNYSLQSTNIEKKINHSTSIIENVCPSKIKVDNVNTLEENKDILKTESESTDVKIKTENLKASSPLLTEDFHGFINEMSNQKLSIYGNLINCFEEYFKFHRNSAVISKSTDEQKTTLKRGRKRKLQEYNKIINENNNVNSRASYAKKKTEKSSTKISDNSGVLLETQFSLPLSPADSDISMEKKDTIGLKKNRRGKDTQQRYSSEDLYKPRLSFTTTRRSNVRNSNL